MNTTDQEANGHATAQTVTIIITNYNHAKYLPTSLGGILEQTRPADEVIVIDDGSTDDSLEVINGLICGHQNVRVIENRQNMGVQATIARAIAAVNSDWLVWAAADDKLLPNFLERGMAMIEKTPNIGVVFSQLATFHDVTGKITEYSDTDLCSAFHIGRQPVFYTPQSLLERLSHSYLWLSGNTAIVRKDALHDVGDFIPELEWHSDWFAFYAVALRYGACGIPETLAMMRVVPETYSSQGMNNRQKQHRVMNAIVDVLNRPQFEDLRKCFYLRANLFSPFAVPMLKALLLRFKDYDLAVRLLKWAADHRAKQFNSQLKANNFSKLGRSKLRVKLLFASIGSRILAQFAP